MKFQDSSMHGSKITGGTKKSDPPTHGQAKGNKMLIPEQGCYVTQSHLNKHNTLMVWISLFDHWSI